MSYTVTEGFVQAYQRNVYMLAEQKGSMLQGAVNRVSQDEVDGKKISRNRLGGATAQKKTQRHGDTPYNEIEHSRRWLTLADWDTAELIDWNDRLKLNTDPQNSYAVRQGSALGRAKDETIIDALLGNAEYGEEGGSFVALPATQQIAAGYGESSGQIDLTLNKLRHARVMLRKAQIIGKGEKAYFVGTTEQLDSLLRTTKVTSSDYAAVKALVSGEINTYLGFEFIWVDGKRQDGSLLVPVDGSGYRRCMAFPKKAVDFAIAKNVVSDIGVRRDKSNAIQVYSMLSLGAVRMEDNAVVEVLCDETTKPSDA